MKKDSGGIGQPFILACPVKLKLLELEIGFGFMCS